ncbi:MAG TPA: dTDP-4-dehydrorhamnose reductase [Pseudonocardiaceae bacterium]
MSGIAVLVPGGRGQLGSDIARIAAGLADTEPRRGETETTGGPALPRVGFVHAPGSSELDITDADAVADAIATLAVTASDAGLRPVVINAAAYTAVDAAESDQDRAFAVNARGPELLAAACARHDTPLLQVSTDYVFDGQGTRPYEPDDPTGPRSVYGRSKLAGERAVLDSGARAVVVRTAWVYGATGANFVKTMCRLARERETLNVVDDQVGSPTWSADLARGLLELAGLVVARPDAVPPVLHCVNAGRTSWFGFARAIFAELGADPERVRPCSTADFPRPAPRPAYSVLSGAAWTRAGLTALRPWRDALAAAFVECGFGDPAEPPAR